MQIEEEDETFVFLNNKISHRLSTTNTDDGDATVALAAATETIFNTNRSSSTVTTHPLLVRFLLSVVFGIRQ